MEGLLVSMSAVSSQPCVDCHRCSPNRVTGHESVKYEGACHEVSVRARQLITQNAFPLNRDVIITQGTGTRPVLVYNEAPSGPTG
ncbi:hypothetical protein CgunFtcFv8_018219 [Champsocephalus gunnari]|uniref:Uncharacterized protein n=1 Tax=Champsocephalus gunnari TaxID=52237 RepID=A0AAN8HS15_CHAGU|nr:hypothetical protein CgunFtcFv8_018219 [Champsocephalus gunnari]